jgi:hypothetical protein
MPLMRAAARAAEARVAVMVEKRIVRVWCWWVVLVGIMSIKVEVVGLWYRGDDLMSDSSCAAWLSSYTLL